MQQWCVHVKSVRGVVVAVVADDVAVDVGARFFPKLRRARRTVSIRLLQSIVVVVVGEQKAPKCRLPGGLVQKTPALLSRVRRTH